VSYSHDKAGRITDTWQKNGINENRNYDALSQLNLINIGTTIQPDSIGVHAYTHDNTGRRTSHNNSGTNVNYTYDNADQVTGSTGDISRAYNYDAAGNRTTATQFGSTIDNFLTTSRRNRRILL
jgi:YD repeat-containing protein